MALPSSWIYYESKTRNGDKPKAVGSKRNGNDGIKQLVFGLNIDKVEKKYEFYATNFVKVWKESLTVSEIVQKANALGMEDVRDDKECRELGILLESLQVDTESANVVFSLVKSDSDGHATSELHVELTGDIKWKFTAIEQVSSVSSSVFSQLNFQLFSQNDFMSQRIKLLENLLEEKDHYINFLTENYRAVNGDELLKKYKGDSAIRKFDKESMLRESKVKYKKPKNIWKVIEQALGTTPSPSKKQTLEIKAPPPKRVNDEPQEQSAQPTKKPRRLGGMTIGRRIKRKQVNSTTDEPHTQEVLDTQADTVPDAHEF